MNKYLKERVKLIRGMEKAIKVLEKDRRTVESNFFSFIKNLPHRVRKNIKENLSMSIEEVGQVTYMKEGKSVRQRAVKLSRYLTRNYFRDIGCNQYILNGFCILTTNAVCPTNNDDRFSIIRGDTIADWYANGYSYNVDSCMADNYLIDYGVLDLYTLNPDKVEMLIYHNPENGARGRALLWKIQIGTTEEGKPIYKKFRDLVYTSGHDEVNWQFEQWRIAHIEELLTYDDFHNCTSAIPEGKIRPQISLKVPEHEHFPYVDTFYHAVKWEDGIIVLSNSEHSNGVKLRSTYGGHTMYRSTHNLIPHQDREEEYYDDEN